MLDYSTVCVGDKFGNVTVVSKAVVTQFYCTMLVLTFIFIFLIKNLVFNDIFFFRGACCLA